MTTVETAAGADRTAHPLEIRPDAVAPIQRAGRRPAKLLLLGAGALVGWGLLDHERGLPGRLADQLVQRSGRGLDLDVVVEPDPTGPAALALLQHLSIARYDAVVVVLGERDGLQRIGRGAWSKELADLAALLDAEASAGAPVLVLDSAQPMVAVSATGLKRLRARGSAGRLAQVARGALAGGRIGFEQLAPPTAVLGWGRQFATADYRRWAERIADRLLPELQRAAEDRGPDTAAALRQRPQDEPRRQAAVDALRLTAATRDGLLDGIVRQARTAYRAEAAYFSVVDGDRVWQRASTHRELRAMPRHLSFCDRTVLQDRTTVFADTRLDPRFGGEVPTLMGTPVAFYAGEPVHALDGHRVGVLCVTDAAPRVVHPAQLAELHVLAGRIEKELWTQALPGR